MPIVDIPYYGFLYVWIRLYRFFSSEGRLSFWGPRIKGIDKLLKKYSLLEICAIQWKRCVDKAESELELINPKHVYKLRYEDFVAHPEKELKCLVSFMNLSITDDQIKQLVLGVSRDNVGKWKKELDKKTQL